jgi:hypothetical protein
MQRRFEDLQVIDEAGIEAILAAGDDVTLQYSSTKYSQEVLRAIDALCAKFGERVEVRFYGHHFKSFDCTHLRALPSIKTLSLDCLQSVAHAEELWNLPNLTRLSLGVFELGQRDILSGANLKSLTRLSVGENRGRNIDLAPVSAMKGLRDLFIAGHANGIAAVAGLLKLEKLGLSMQARQVKLAFVNELGALRSLLLILGGRDDIEEVEHPRLTSLEVIRVRGLSKLRPDAFPGLTDLRVEDQLRLDALEFSKTNRNLRQIRLINCKGLKSVAGLKSLAALEHLRVYRTALRLGVLLGSGMPPTLRTLAFYTGKASADREIRKKLDMLGWAEWHESE